MSDLSGLPELGDLIPKVPGSVYEYLGAHWVGADSMRAAEMPEGYEDHDRHGVGRKGDLIRVGFKLYEIMGYVSAQNAYWVRPFKATLTEGELMALSGQAAL